ncbi:hypothetical protein CCR94_04910 [Rhodoblastus sphagnicola]|uniref:Uncharacterized protein n=1 Tax=Rhodoblastus sphagnicola TaxID=333368 RepID=A0A2S6ND43_9HYPH|nr:hypothetical protein [Rhodoblastus sphagnicola]MBB4198043.1 hypothetical protein [Rhodoblastus sphagnicola]PPQ32529.1 hypothetical protein CCR94_04910 [Rhodoblastus sphagnicola]
MAFKTKALRYLGGLSGRGDIVQNGKKLAPTTFDLDGYYRAAAGVSGCGEIRLASEMLRSLFGRSDLQLLTEQGQVFDIKFSDHTLPASSCVAHIDLSGNMDPADWRRGDAADNS